MSCEQVKEELFRLREEFEAEVSIYNPESAHYKTHVARILELVELDKWCRAHKDDWILLAGGVPRPSGGGRAAVAQTVAAGAMSSAIAPKIAAAGDQIPIDLEFMPQAGTPVPPGVPALVNLNRSFREDGALLVLGNGRLPFPGYSRVSAPEYLQAQSNRTRLAIAIAAGSSALSGFVPWDGTGRHPFHFTQPNDSTLYPWKDEATGETILRRGLGDGGPHVMYEYLLSLFDVAAGPYEGNSGDLYGGTNGRKAAFGLEPLVHLFMFDGRLAMKKAGYPTLALAGVKLFGGTLGYGARLGVLGMNDLTELGVGVKGGVEYLLSASEDSVVGIGIHGSVAHDRSLDVLTGEFVESLHTWSAQGSAFYRCDGWLGVQLFGSVGGGGRCGTSTLWGAALELNFK